MHGADGDFFSIKDNNTDLLWSKQLEKKEKFARNVLVRAVLCSKTVARVHLGQVSHLWWKKGACSGSIPPQPGEFLACSRRDRESGGFSQIWHVKQLLIAVAESSSSSYTQEERRHNDGTWQQQQQIGLLPDTVEIFCVLQTCLVFFYKHIKSVSKWKAVIYWQWRECVWRKTTSKFFSSVWNVFFCVLHGAK